GDLGLRRPLENAEREDHDKVDRQGRPVELAERGNAARDLTTHDVNSDNVAKLESEGVPHLAIERDQQRPTIVSQPPATADDAAAARHGRRPSDAAITFKHPALADARQLAG